MYRKTPPRPTLKRDQPSNATNHSNADKISATQVDFNPSKTTKTTIMATIRRPTLVSLYHYS